MRILLILSLLALATGSAKAITTFSQMMEKNLREQRKENPSLYRTITIAEREENPKSLSAFTHTSKDTRTAILEKFPLGTPAAQILREFPLQFTLIEVRTDELNGIRIRTEGEPDTIIGTRSLILTVDKQWPVGIAPFIQYRFAYLAFDAKGNLLEVNVVDEVDAL